MSRNSTDYEVFVEKLAQRIANSKDIEISGPPKFGTKNKIIGASGFPHQIDVSIEYRSQDGQNRLKLVECKLRSKENIHIEEMLIFHARIKDIQQNVGDIILVEGNMFTTLGYSKPAQIYADFYQIATNTLQNDLEAWSVSFADQVVIGLRTASINLTPQSTKAISKDKEN